MSKYHTREQQKSQMDTWCWTCTCTSHLQHDCYFKKQRVGGVCWEQKKKKTPFTSMNPDLIFFFRRWQRPKVALKREPTMQEAAWGWAWDVRLAAVLLSRFLRSAVKNSSFCNLKRQRNNQTLRVSVLLGSHIPFAGHIAAFSSLLTSLCLSSHLLTLCSAFWAEFEHWGPV